jgi:hypothetical protein
MPSTLQSQGRTSVAELISHDNSALPAHYVDAAEFRRLIVSNRRMERADKSVPKMRGLRDLETGELFLTDERWLIDGMR